MQLTLLVMKVLEKSKILCITHLPQVAVNGHSHFLITKDVKNSLPTSKQCIDGESRIDEISRMLHGEQTNESINMLGLFKNK